jgi:hypothetical protein
VDSDKSKAGIVDIREDSYPRKMALRLLAEEQAQRNGRKLDWASPVCEGVTYGVFDL